MPAIEFERAAVEGIGFCRAVMGTDLRDTPVVGGEAGFPDMHAVADPSTLAPVPWEPGVEACLADLVRATDGVPEPIDPRAAVKRAVAAFAELGYVPRVGPELEFHLCRVDPADPGRVSRYLDRPSMVYAVGPQADPERVVHGLAGHLADRGLEVLAVTHEFADSQYEINLRDAPALIAADRAFLLRSAVKDLAAQRGLVATFMGKPFNDQAGSGFHLHISLEHAGAGAGAGGGGDGEKTGNAFVDPADPHGVSQLLHAFTAGVLHHGAALMALLNPTINSYRRIVPGSLAPTHADWGWDNRVAMVRIPPERHRATRLEVRVGDASANAYLAVAAVLFAGLHGVRESLEPGAPLHGNGDGDGDGGGGGRRAAALPRSLEQSMQALAHDRILCDQLGSELIDTFLAIKRSEIDRHREWVSDWEIAEYLRAL